MNKYKEQIANQENEAQIQSGTWYQSQCDDD